MRKNADFLMVVYFAFFALVMLSGTISGVLSEVVFYLAYILPFFLAVTVLKKNAGEKSLFSLDKSRVKLFLPTIFPTVFLIVLLSYLSSILIFFAFGKVSTVSMGENVAVAILYHALLPALLEELLFRYLPLRILSHTSPRRAVLISAICFAFAHASPYQIPYALVAGVIFAVLDLSFLSILPSIIIHFLNNTLSLTLTYGYLSGVPKPLLYTISASVVAVSVLYIAYRSGDKIKSFMGRR